MSSVKEGQRDHTFFPGEQAAMADDRPLYYFLHNTLKICIVDDDSGVREFIRDILAPIKIFSVHTASSAREGAEILSSLERVHLCIYDLGLCDINNDEFFLLKQFGNHVAFLVFTGSTSPAKGYTAHKLGAKSVIEKSSQFKRQTFTHTVFEHAFRALINPRYEQGADTLSTSTDMLIQHTPQFVSQWAMRCGITDRELRHIWSKNLGANAKIIITLNHVFQNAFTYFMRAAYSEKAPPKLRLGEMKTYRRLEEYFHLHRRTIMDFISYANITTIQEEQV